MKKAIIIILASLLTLAANEAKAQLVYEPFISGSSRSSSQAQTVRTTAYCSLGGGQYQKLPVVVEIRRDGAYVVQYYRAPQSLVYGENGRWVDIYPAALRKCYPDLSSNPLEQSFMYKAGINGRTYYMDL